MTSRRTFLGTMTAGLGAAAFARPSWAADTLTPNGPVVAGRPHRAPALQPARGRAQDLAGTLARVVRWGSSRSRAPACTTATSPPCARPFDKAGLKCSGSHIGYDRWQKDTPGALKEAKALGARFATVAWIKGEKEFTREDALRAAEVFNAAGKACAAEGVRFATTATATSSCRRPRARCSTPSPRTPIPSRWHSRSTCIGRRRAAPIRRRSSPALPGRVPLLHVKDMAKGLSLPPGSSSSDNSTNVVVGTGQIDWPAVFRAAKASGGEIYYIEDESPKVWEQLPQSLRYLGGLQL